MALPKLIKPDALYAVTVTRPVKLPDGDYLLPSHEEIVLSGAVLSTIKDQVADAVERVVAEPESTEPVSALVRQVIGPRPSEVGDAGLSGAMEA